MFAGHLGIALALGRVERRVNVGVFIGAALLLDAVLWLLVLLGLESVAIPADYPLTRRPEFVFPYSHSLLAAIGWSVAAGAAALSRARSSDPSRLRVAALAGAAVLSHWLLDAIVHVPGLPLAGADSAKAGLGLWRDLPTALGLETAIALAGLWLFARASPLSLARTCSLAALTVAVTMLTVAGMTVAPAPPSASAMAGGSLATLVVVFVLALWIGRLPGGGQSA